MNIYGGDILERIKEEIRQKIIDFLKSHNIQCDEEMNYTDSLIKLLDLNVKWIPTQKRSVLYSEELQNKMDGVLSQDTVELIRFFEKEFVDGKNINSHLSRNIFVSKNYDKLLNHWNIHHLHLKKDEATSDEGMRNNRSSTYLLFLVDSENVYFLDCVPHLQGDEFADLNFIEIIFNNGWLDVVPLIKLENVVELGVDIRNKEEIYALWKNNINISAYRFGDAFYSVGKGVSRAGNRLPVTLIKCELEKILFNLSQDPSFSLISVEILSDEYLLSIKFNQEGMEKQIVYNSNSGFNCFEL